MKKRILCVILLALAGCKEERDSYNGYVEGEYVYISPTTSGILGVLSVVRGQSVKEGDALFSLDTTNLDASRVSAANEILKAKAALVNLKEDYKRAQSLVASNAVSQSLFDARKANYEAAEASVHIAEQRAIQLEKQRAEASPVALASGYIEDTYYKAGEFVKEGAPVISLLPPGNVKIRFFVPQADLPRFVVGNKVSITCDGCKNPVPATVNYISSQSEYSPPVIYSVGSRDKLVFLVEAKPDVADATMKPGLPVDIIVDRK